MRLYLSSYRLGHHVDKLLKLVGKNPRVGIISNALDNISANNRFDYQNTVYNSHSVFDKIGFEAHDIDLRKYFKNETGLYEDLQKCDLVWVTGGNCFTLRRAMRYSGFDTIIRTMLNEDAIAYGGFSAGVCVLSPTLHGLELCDQAERTPEDYNAEILWDGLSIIPFSVAPHYRSDHPEAPMIEDVVSYFKIHDMPYRTLRDGDVLICNGSELKLHELEDGQPNPLDRDQNKIAPNTGIGLQGIQPDSL